MTTLSGWGRYPVATTRLESPSALDQLQKLLRSGEGAIVRGNGRAYGDAAVGAQFTVSGRFLSHVKSFDHQSGLIHVGAGTLLSDIISTFLPLGFFPPVVPGTKFVTIGGMIAADVHGKNHHRDGGFGDHLEQLTLMTPNGEIASCSREQRRDLFDATIGGMGLTGAILDAQFKLRRVETSWIEQRTIVAPNLLAAVDALSEADSATYSVAWIDCLARGSALGRSLVYLGEHLSKQSADKFGVPSRFEERQKRAFAVPFDLPNFVLNRWSVQAFNNAYFHWGARNAGEPFISRLDPYFFPLDSLLEWNRIYGRRGFIEHQCVISSDKAKPVLHEILERVAKRGDASFLCVLKKFGRAGDGVLSFPKEGYTLAFDAPIGPGLLEFLDEIDRIIVAAQGRIYLAKDARQSRSVFEAGYPGLQRFREICREVDPGRKLRSKLSDRLGIK